MISKIFSHTKRNHASKGMLLLTRIFSCKNHSTGESVTTISKLQLDTITVIIRLIGVFSATRFMLITWELLMIKASLIRYHGIIMCTVDIGLTFQLVMKLVKMHWLLKVKSSILRISINSLELTVVTTISHHSWLVKWCSLECLSKQNQHTTSRFLMAF